MNAEQPQFDLFLAELEHLLKMLSIPFQIAFGASCCERAFPNYRSFSKNQNWGDPRALRSGIDHAWSVAAGNAANMASINALEDRCKRSTPDSDNFPGGYATAAQEAAFMVSLLLEFLKTENSGLLVRIARFSRDTVDQHVQIEQEIDASDPELEEKIANDPLMIAELKCQRTDLQALGQIQSQKDLDTFIKRAGARTSNIGVLI